MKKYLNQHEDTLKVIFLISMNLLIITLLSGCNKTEASVEMALRQAGENRAELERVLEHYADDAEKLAAAEFLISNMPGHYSYADTALINRYYDEVDIALDRLEGAKRQTIADTINAIARKLNIQKAAIVQDVKIIKADFLIRNIDEAFDQWRNDKWARHLTQDQFREYLLPYKVLDLQPLDSWRGEFRHFHTDSLYELDYCDMFRNSSYSAAVVMNLNLGEVIKPFIWNAIECPVYRIPTRCRIPFGTCDDYAYMSAVLFRSVGIPTSIEVNPHWAYRSLGHRANAIIAPSGKSIIFSGLSTGPDKTHHADEKLAKMYRVTYARNRELTRLNQSGEYVPDFFKNLFLKDVTDEYIATTDISVETSHKTNGYVYLAVYGDNSWTPVDFSYQDNSKASFAKAGLNIMYMVISYNQDGTICPVSCPFVLDNEGKVNYIEPDTHNTETVSLYRKYPVIEYVHKYARLINDGEFEASDSPDFTNPTLIHRITDGKAVGHEVILPDTLPAFRYWRYIQRHRNAHCNMGEVIFYDHTGRKLSGKVIGTEGHRTIYEGMTRENLFDGDLLTSFNSPNPNGDWAGLDFGTPVKISKIIFYGRGDGNTVEIGDLYELYHWHDGDWRSLGQKTAGGVSLTYDNVPRGALLLLRDLTKGKDERIFMIDSDGRQQWW